MQKIKGSFFGKSILSVDQFSVDDVKEVFEKASFYKLGLSRGVVFKDLSGKIITALFYEPSSRTFGSFVTAIQRLGGGFIPLQGVTYSSVSKGETLEDTVRTFESYSDAIVMRHSETGASKRAASVLSIPLINAGDGTGEHPTQALLDLFTIQERIGKTEGLKIAMVGDLKYGRTVHSLSKLLANYKGNTFYYISPPQSPMPGDILSLLNKKGAKVYQVGSIAELIERVDVLYMTRVQKERMEPAIYEKIKNMFILDGKMAGKMKKKAIIMHPFPRVNELPLIVDSNPRASYLTHQMRNGLYIRMALLSLVLKR